MMAIAGYTRGVMMNLLKLINILDKLESHSEAMTEEDKKFVEQFTQRFNSDNTFMITKEDQERITSIHKYVFGE